MASTLRSGLLVVVAMTGVSACASVLGGFDFDGKTGGTGGMTSTTGSGGAGGTVSTTGTATGSGTSSSTSTGGTMCVDPVKDCSAPANECVTAVCDGGGLCAVKNVANGTALAAQTPADCKKAVCDGAGKITSVDDDSDIHDDGLECTKDTCAAGVEAHTPVAAKTACGAGGMLKCDAVGACVGCVDVSDCGVAATCKALTCNAGACGVANAPDASACNDANACTKTDTCKAGVCTGGNPTVCTALDQCHDIGACNFVTGICPNPVTGDGSPCSDANLCTTSDTCQAGVCTGGNPTVCKALDQCHDIGTCNTATGICANPVSGDGTPCSDGDACTTVDACQAGTCTGAVPVVCVAMNQCHAVGTCNSATGTCSNPNQANGTACTDGNNCTTGDTCQAGTCAGSPVVCSALDSCHAIGTCNSATGTCTNPLKGNGAACNDADLCTMVDVCTAGTCVGTPVVCAPLDACHNAGTCAPGTGLCSNPSKPNGTSCGGVKTCVGGVCQ
jgi:hypothetical protein